MKAPEKSAGAMVRHFEHFRAQIEGTFVMFPGKGKRLASSFSPLKTEN